MSNWQYTMAWSEAPRGQSVSTQDERLARLLNTKARQAWTPEGDVYFSMYMC